MTSARPTAAARPWRCQACGTLLGMERDGELHVKYKEAEYWIRGRCRHVCRRCGATNALPVPETCIAPSSRFLPGNRR